MKNPETLSDLRNHLYQQAEIRWVWSLLLAVGTLLLTVVALFVRAQDLVAAMGLFAVILPIAVTWLREMANSMLLRGDKCRRLILYSDGLGLPISAAQLAEIRAWSLGSNLGAAPFVPPYYASTIPVGPRRLADITTESAFFTSILTSKIQTVLWIVFGISIVLSLSALFLTDLFKAGGADQMLVATKAIALFMAFLISGDMALLAKKYGDLRSAAQLTFTACARLRDEVEPSLDEVRALTEEYGIALIQCPPIPTGLYVRYRDSLNDLYRDSHQ